MLDNLLLFVAIVLQVNFLVSFEKNLDSIYPHNLKTDRRPTGTTT
jgi:hypothetical protein